VIEHEFQPSAFALERWRPAVPRRQTADGARPNSNAAVPVFPKIRKNSVQPDPTRRNVRPATAIFPRLPYAMRPRAYHSAAHEGYRRDYSTNQSRQDGRRSAGIDLPPASARHRRTAGAARPPAKLHRTNAAIRTAPQRTATKTSAPAPPRAKGARTIAAIKIAQPRNGEMTAIR
jgi:hypothetical protein